MTITITKIGNQRITGQYVHRGDAVAADYVLGDLTDDNAWHDMDLSAIVGVGTVAVRLKVGCTGTSVNKTIEFRKNGNSNEHTTSMQEIIVANINQYAEHIVACDSGRIIEYRINDMSGTTIWILGWWL